MRLTYDENMMLLFYSADTKTKFFDNIRAMQAQLQPDETKLRRLSDSVVKKVRSMSEDEFHRRMKDAGL